MTHFLYWPLTLPKQLSFTSVISLSSLVQEPVQEPFASRSFFEQLEIAPCNSSRIFNYKGYLGYDNCVTHLNL
jgi:hypothetical protein